MRGYQVRNLQMSLQDNAYGNFLPGGDGAVDSEYGPLTAQAVHRAKFWLGYSASTINQVAGGHLRDLLAGKAKLSLAMAARRHVRVAQHQAALKARPTRVKALGYAISQIGQTEHPANSNICKFTEWYGEDGAPWCAMFVSWCYVQAGSKAFQAGVHYAYCPYIVADARAGRNNLTITHDPQPGDLVLYDWDGDGVADHVGLFREWNGPGHVAFTAVEGNTSGSSNSNGGIVMNRPDRLIGEVIAFVHVGA
jgi:hypothetical protein